MVSDNWSPGTAVQGAVPARSNGTRDAGRAREAVIRIRCPFCGGRSESTQPDRPEVSEAVGR